MRSDSSAAPQIRSHLSGADGTTQFVPKMLIIVAPGSVYVANLTLNFYRIDAANVEARNAHWALMWFHVEVSIADIANFDHRDGWWGHQSPPMPIRAHH